MIVTRSFDAVSIVDVVGVDAVNRGHHAQFVLPFELVESLPHIASPLVVRPTRWRRGARHALAAASPSPTSLRTVARADVTVMPFQLEPALAVTHGLGTRVLIADAVGLGKTIQASMIVAETLARAGEGHALVLCPAGLRQQWRDELEARFDVRGSVIDSAALACRPPTADGTVNPWAAGPVVIASIDYVKRPEVLRGLEELVWDVVVLDEAHALSGRSDRAAAASALASRARTVVLLTATPHSGDAQSFARMCDLGRLTSDPPLLVFRRTRRDAGLAETRRVRWLWIRPTPVEHRMHVALGEYMNTVWRTHGDASHPAALAMLVLARRAASSAHSLARSIERRLELLLASDENAGAQLALPFADHVADDDEPLAELAARGLGDLSEECGHLERVLTLARTAARHESKLRRLTRFLAAVGEPVIVFTEYRDTLASLAATLTNFNCALLHGGMSAMERRRAAEAFTHGDASVLLATDAASEGLNLHHRCRLVINLELPWTPLRLEQRVGRVDRIGQRRIVHAVHLVGRASTEAELLRRLKIREECAQLSLEAISMVTPQELASMAIGRGENPAPPFSRSSFAHAGITPDLRDQSLAEASRITVARALSHTGGNAITRPFATAFRTRRGAPRTYWLWRVRIETPDERWLWDGHVAIVAHTSRLSCPSARVVRRLLAPDSRLDGLRDVAAQEASRGFQEAMRLPLATAMARERAIAARLAAQQRTLATSLIQRGLFNRRAEREAGQWRTVVGVAVDRSAARVADLVRSQSATAADRQLVFAVILG